MTPVGTFMKYALPCVASRLRDGRLKDKSVYDKFEQDCLNAVERDKSELEKMFESAFTVIKKYAAGKEIWSGEVIKGYWRKEHNLSIDRGEEGYDMVPEKLRRFCKVYEVEIVGKQDKSFNIRYPFNQKDSRVNAVLLPDAKVGDRITVHLGYAIEKI